MIYLIVYSIFSYLFMAGFFIGFYLTFNEDHKIIGWFTVFIFILSPVTFILLLGIKTADTLSKTF